MTNLQVLWSVKSQYFDPHEFFRRRRSGSFNFLLVVSPVNLQYPICHQSTSASFFPLSARFGDSLTLGREQNPAGNALWQETTHLINILPYSLYSACAYQICSQQHEMNFLMQLCLTAAVKGHLSWQDLGNRNFLMKHFPAGGNPEGPAVLVPIWTETKQLSVCQV